MSTQESQKNPKDQAPKRDRPIKVLKWQDKSSQVRSQEAGNKSSADFQLREEPSDINKPDQGLPPNTSNINKPDQGLPSSGSNINKPDNTLPSEPKK